MVETSHRFPQLPLPEGAFLLEEVTAIRRLVQNVIQRPIDMIEIPKQLDRIAGIVGKKEIGGGIFLGPQHLHFKESSVHAGQPFDFRIL